MVKLKDFAEVIDAAEKLIEAVKKAYPNIDAEAVEQTCNNAIAVSRNKIREDA